MNEYSIITAMRDAVNGNAALAAWCDTTYGRGPFLYVGVDPANPPPQEHYPLVAFYPMSRATGTALDDAETGIMVEMGIADDSVVEQDEGNENMVEYSGIGNVIVFRRLVLTALKAADLDGGFIAAVEADYDPVLEFPLFTILNAVTVRRPYAFREDRII